LLQPAQAIAVCCLFTAVLFGGSAPAAADPTTDRAHNDELAGLIPAGSADCQVGQQYPEDPFLARLGCGQNSQPGGPYGAVYSLYGSPADMDAAFGRLAGSGSPVACPGAADAQPVSWGGGMVVCTTARGPREGAPTVSWTKASNLFVGSASGGDLDSLYAWWLGAR
jgi:serine/threonine-protein kinase